MSAAPDPCPAEQAVIDRFGIFDEEAARVDASCGDCSHARSMHDGYCEECACEAFEEIVDPS